MASRVVLILFSGVHLSSCLPCLSVPIWLSGVPFGCHDTISFCNPSPLICQAGSFHNLRNCIDIATRMIGCQYTRSGCSLVRHIRRNCLSEDYILFRRWLQLARLSQMSRHNVRKWNPLPALPPKRTSHFCAFVSTNSQLFPFPLPDRTSLPSCGGCFFSSISFTNHFFLFHKFPHFPMPRHAGAGRGNAARSIVDALRRCAEKIK